jgi:hypothetical protein
MIDSLLSGNIGFVIAMSTIITGLVIVLSYYLGEAIGNPKISLWAKTEVIQLFISVFMVVFIVFAIQSFCSIDASGFSVFMPQGTSIPSMTIYDAAYAYTYSASEFTHNSLSIQRYYLGAYDLLEGKSYWNCKYTGCDEWWCCLFGTSGVSTSPGSYFQLMPSLSVTFNTSIFSYLSALNYMFILEYAYTGILFFLLPLGIIFRAIPYMRHLGSLLIAVCLSFIIVYPGILSIFYIFAQASNSPISFTGYLGNNAKYIGQEEYLANPPSISEGILFIYGRDEPNAIALSGKAFIIGVLIPTIALLATIASVKYSSKMIGEDIDLSRVIQMI